MRFVQESVHIGYVKFTDPAVEVCKAVSRYISPFKNVESEMTSSIDPGLAPVFYSATSVDVELLMGRSPACELSPDGSDHVILKHLCHCTYVLKEVSRLTIITV